MRNRGLYRLLLTLIVMVVAGNSLSVPAQASSQFIEGNDPAAVMFDPTVVNQITLEMSPSDYEALKSPNVSWDNEGPWRQTTMKATIAGKKYGPLKVGVHLKGAWGSWRDVNSKAAFKVKMDAFVPKQTLLGIKKLTLNNMVQDPSYIHEVMTYKLMRDLGLPAPRAGYANVSLNGVNYGIHLNVETIDKTFLKRWGISSKHLYKGGVPNFPDFWSGSEGNYVVESGSTTDKSDLTAFIAANQYSGDAWWNAISQIADMKQITMVWAVELYAGHWDGYTLNLNNYYLNFDKNGQVKLLSWGTDQTWGSDYDYFSFRGMMPARCMESTACHEMYLQNLATIAKVASTTDLANYGSLVAGGALSDALLEDPWSDGPAWNNQRWAINESQLRLSDLQSMVVPWDTTIKTVNIGKKTYSPLSTIYLPVNTKMVTVSLTPTQPDATSPMWQTFLKPGLNKLDLPVTSADGEHTNSSAVNLYVLRQRSTSANLSFKPSSIGFTTAGSSSMKLLAKALNNAKNIELALSYSAKSSQNLGEKRISQIVQTLKQAGIQVSQVSKLKSAGPKDQILIKVRYQN